jgi:hypothetical protein
MLRASSQPPEPQANARRDASLAELADLQIPPPEWRAIVTLRPNVLAEGPDRSTERLIRAIIDALQSPVCEWDHLTESRETGATLLVRHIDVLSLEELRRLLKYLNADEGPTRIRQVIATSARPLYPLVESGLFLADLYYRLNTIRLELGDIPQLGVLTSS